MFQYHFFIGSFFNSFQSLIIQKRSHALKSTFKSCLKTKRNFKEVQGTQKTSFTMSKAQPKSLTLEQIKNKKPGFLFFQSPEWEWSWSRLPTLSNGENWFRPKGLFFFVCTTQSWSQRASCPPFSDVQGVLESFEGQFLKDHSFDENWGQFISIFYLGDTLSIFRKPLKALI